MTDKLYTPEFRRSEQPDPRKLNVLMFCDSASVADNYQKSLFDDNTSIGSSDIKSSVVETVQIINKLPLNIDPKATDVLVIYHNIHDTYADQKLTTLLTAVGKKEQIMKQNSVSNQSRRDIPVIVLSAMDKPTLENKMKQQIGLRSEDDFPDTFAHHFIVSSKNTADINALTIGNDEVGVFENLAKRKVKLLQEAKILSPTS